MRCRVRRATSPDSRLKPDTSWPEFVPGAGRDSESLKKIVIYCRYPSDMQRPDSCADQERTIRAALARLGFVAADIIARYDEAQSGTKTARDGFQQLRGMVARGEVAVLVVDDQSRLTRADNANSFVKDLVFAGGRFISTGEGIDTAVTGWELKVKVLQLHHGQTVRDLQHRVHRGQRGGWKRTAAPAISASGTSRSTSTGARSSAAGFCSRAPRKWRGSRTFGPFP